MSERHEVRVSRLLDRWLEKSPLQRQWITMGPFRVYFRKSPVSLLGTIHRQAITLANVTSMPEQRHTRKFRPILEWMEEKLRTGEVTVIYVENVFSQRLRTILETHGWQELEDPISHIPSYYKEREL